MVSRKPKIMENEDQRIGIDIADRLLRPAPDPRKVPRTGVTPYGPTKTRWFGGGASHPGGYGASTPLLEQPGIFRLRRLVWG